MASWSPSLAFPRVVLVGYSGYGCLDTAVLDACQWCPHHELILSPKSPWVAIAPASSPWSLGTMAALCSTRFVFSAADKGAVAELRSICLVCLSSKKIGPIPQICLLHSPQDFVATSSYSADAFDSDHSFQLAVVDSNVPLLGFILAFKGFYVDVDGVRGISWECLVWTLVFSALSS